MYLSIRLSVMCLCRSLNVLTHHCADVPFNWRCPAAALLASSQQACCVLMVQGDHLSAKPGNVRDFTKRQGSVSKEILSGKSGLKLFI